MVVLLPAAGVCGGSPSTESSAAYLEGAVDEPLRTCAQVFSEAPTGCRTHCSCSFKTLATVRIKGFLKTPHYLPLSLEGCLWGRGSSPVTTAGPYLQVADGVQAHGLKLGSLSLWGTLLTCWGPWPPIASRCPFGRHVQE